MNGPSIKPGTWNIPEHPGTFGNIPEHGVIIIIMRKVCKIKFSTIKWNDQIVWNNRFITINKASVYFRHWHHAGIHKLSSLLDDYNNRFLSLTNSHKNLRWRVIFYSITASFQQYHVNEKNTLNRNSKLPQLIYLKSICFRVKQFTNR